MKRLPLLLFLFLLGCAPLHQPPPLEAQARHLAETGRFVEAASAFERLALRSGEPKRSIYRLYAARGYLRSGNLSRAGKLLGRIDGERLPPPHDLEYRLLESEWALARGERQRAMELLSLIPRERLTARQRQLYERLWRKLEEGSPPEPGVREIALLLPWSAEPSASEAVEQGFEAMRARRGGPATLRADTSWDPVSAYRKATGLGADLIVGPLLKTEVQEVARVANGQLPILALNVALPSPPPRFYQFALLPEEEVEALTELAARRGGRRALIVVPDSPFGRRIGRAFGSGWRRLGGEVVAVVPYLPKAADFSLYLQRLPESDLVFLAAHPEVAFRIVPTIRALRKVPIYALSQLYLGTPDPWRDRPLDGVVICDLPWIVRERIPGYPSKERFSRFSGIRLRLVAFGMDAYRLATEVIPTHRLQLMGATGRLTLRPGGIIDRDPFCARFQGGSPKPLKR